jgi:hypothetical protein
MSRCLEIVGLTLLASLSSLCQANDKASRCDSLEREDYRHSAYPWQDVTPLEYLTYIRFLTVSSVTVFGCKENWVTEADVPALLDLLDSKEPSPSQKSARSSFWDADMSTVGNEAAWLLQAFRVGRFPPGLNSTRNAPDASELRRWWSARVVQQATQPPDKSAQLKP